MFLGNLRKNNKPHHLSFNSLNIYHEPHHLLFTQIIRILAKGGGKITFAKFLVKNAFLSSGTYEKKTHIFSYLKSPNTATLNYRQLGQFLGCMFQKTCLNKPFRFRPP